jgi:hypothetical protein
LKIVSSEVKGKNPDASTAGPLSLQLLKITEDFALAYRQRENVRHAYIAEKENASQLSSSVIAALRVDIMAGLLAAQESVRGFLSGNTADPARLVEMRRVNARMSGACLLIDALAYLVSIRGQKADSDGPEIHAIVKEVIKKTAAMVDWDNCDFGILESIPGQQVYGSGEGFKHLVFATVSELLAGNFGEGTYFFRIVKHDESVIVSLESACRGEDHPVCADGVFRVASELARELGVIYEVGRRDSGFICRMEFAGI